MTKKDYVLIAGAIRGSRESLSYAPVNKGERDIAVDTVQATIGLALQRDNPRFNYERFLQACGVESN